MTARYAPSRPFPPYAFLPGRAPHPQLDPQGHSYGIQAHATWIDSAHWRDNEHYLFGVDLYNHGFLWEAHESWELIWRASRHDEAQAELLRGLIQIAAGFVQLELGRDFGAQRLLRSGAARLRRSAELGGTEFMGLRPAELADAFETILAQAGSRRRAPPVLQLKLEPP